MYSRYLIPAIMLMASTVVMMILHASLNYTQISDTHSCYNPAECPLSEGDIVFRKGQSLVSTLVLLNDRSTDFSHVGIVCKKDGEMVIVHAVPGEPDEHGNEVVRCDSPEDFFDPGKARKLAVVTLTDASASKKHKAANSALEFFKQKIPFDGAMDFKTDDKLYCTELVWKAWLKAGINITQD
ncbi:MAG: YiiX/YebB-like N1pC/P60 family cysteine hydrolase [Lentimicrobiaceae bacterium]|nr:YiiX/YebB-like N1pC/P60 family cysteine hydrolase [Lentimicrobiaceae bacterium]